MLACASCANIGDGACAAPAIAAVAIDVYVAPDGADSGPGNAAAPFRTIARAAAARPGAIIHVSPGTYRENVQTGTDGRARARVRYVSDIKWGARIVGRGTEATWINYGDYADIADFDISGSGRLGIANYASHTMISCNHVHDLAVSGGCSGGGGIDNANYRGSDGDIIGNVVHGIYSSSLRGRIYNNLVYRASAWSIHLWHAATDATIAHNTVFANGAGAVGGGIVIGAGDAPAGAVLNHTRIVNNIVYDNPAASTMEFCYPGQDCTGIANNLVFNNGGDISLRAGAAAGTIAADPQIVNYQADGSGDYRLKRSSPAIDKRLSTLAPATDIDNDSRQRGAAPDLGAYENY